MDIIHWPGTRQFHVPVLRQAWKQIHDTLNSSVVPRVNTRISKESIFIFSSLDTRSVLKIRYAEDFSLTFIWAGRNTRTLETKDRGERFSELKMGKYKAKTIRKKFLQNLVKQQLCNNDFEGFRSYWVRTSNSICMTLFFCRMSYVQIFTAHMYAKVVMSNLGWGFIWMERDWTGALFNLFIGLLVDIQSSKKFHPCWVCTAMALRRDNHEEIRKPIQG